MTDPATSRSQTRSPHSTSSAATGANSRRTLPYHRAIVTSAVLARDCHDHGCARVLPLLDGPPTRVVGRSRVLRQPTRRAPGSQALRALFPHSRPRYQSVREAAPYARDLALR